MENEVDTRTVTVEMFPGHPRDITKAQFVEIWMEQAREFNKLVNTPGDATMITHFEEWVHKKARGAFEETYTKQSGRKN